MSTPELDFNEIGATGLNRFGGYINEELNRELQGNKYIKVYKEMSTNDAIVGAILFAIEMLIRQVTWDVEAYSSDQEDVANKDFVKSCLDDMSQSWRDTVTDVLSMLTFGWSWHEIVYKQRLGPSEDPTQRSRYNDGLIGWRKISIRAQDSLYKWDFDETGGIQGMWQQPPPDYKLRFIPVEKSLLFRTTTSKGNPEGKSILRNAFRSWYFKRRMENIEAIGIERDLAGLPVAYVPPEIMDVNASNSQKAIYGKIKQIVQNIRRDEQEGLVFPMLYDNQGNKLYDLTLLSTGGRRQFDTTQVIGRYNQSIAMTVMADFILLGHEKVGSFSLSSSKTSLFSTALGAWLDSIADIFNRFALPRLFELNGKSTDKLPKLSHGDIESVDLQELGQYISNLSGAGAMLFPDKELENYLRRQAGMPVTQE